MMFHEIDNTGWIIRNSDPIQSTWTRSDDKLFERALVLFPEDSENRWQKIASEVHGKSPEEVKTHYDELVLDVLKIDSGRVELPSYSDDDSFGFEPELRSSQISFGSAKSKHGEVERKKGTPWTEEEHKLFLIGLDRYGKGDWRSISRNVVVTRTPTQVASHAQKYYLRQNSMKKERKRERGQAYMTLQPLQIPRRYLHQVTSLIKPGQWGIKVFAFLCKDEEDGRFTPCT